ncbi:GNAT family N-acetyltransferase [Micropruina sp.]|uniref:GNAT family N-acetyltransferase n=1 Tax=Micropruina sp. TaxID=2737536 RepID=UPI00261FC159|nr:GNAT family N-acetyltransferase [Micropruina sp.]
MSEVILSEVDEPGREELFELYGSVGWTAYTREPDALVRAVRGSLRVVTARSHGKLVGLARIVGDGTTIAYLQDVLVDPSHRREGLGRRLVETVLQGPGEVRQQVLLTDAEPGQRAFYEALGFIEVGESKPPLRAFFRLR